MELSDDEFLYCFETTRLPRSQWTHAAHVRMAWLYLTALPFDAALARIRSGILRYNTSLGKADAYHDTITVAYACLIAERQRAAPQPDFELFAAAHPDLLDRTMGVLMRHYSRECLYSDAARQGLVAPDLEAIPHFVTGLGAP